MRKILINVCILLAWIIFLCGTQISFASEISIPSLDREGAVVSFCENKNFTNADEMKNILDLKKYSIRNLEKNTF